MRDSLIFLAILIVGCSALFVGSRFRNTPVASDRSGKTSTVAVPSIGSIQILNGCGAFDAAGRMAELLRKKGFDVKSNGIGNASSFNYALTLVVSRTTDMNIAVQVGDAIGLPRDRVVLARQSPEQGFDVTVFVGSDYEGVFK